LAHLHPDQIAGALNTDGTAAFDNAHLHLVDTEHDYWMNGSFDAVDVNGSDWAGLAQAVISAYSDRLNLVAQSKEIGTVRQNELETGWAVSYPLRMTKHSPFRYFKTSPEIIRLAVALGVQLKVKLFATRHQIPRNASVRPLRMYFQ